MNASLIGSNWSRQAYADKVVVHPVAGLKALGRQTRRHTAHQVEQIAASLRQFGWVNPLLVDEHFRVISGLGRLAAARSLGWFEAPCLIVAHLTAIEKRAYALADNRLSDLAEWDREVLEVEMAELVKLDPNFSLDVTGFDLAEIEFMGLGVGKEKDAAEDEHPKPTTPVSQLGDVWLCGDHLIGCADATDPASLEHLAPGEIFAACVTDAPYNIKIKGMVTSKSSHREFVMGSGEMSDEEFTDFLVKSYGAAAGRLAPGALLYAAMDWRHAANVLAAAIAIHLELLNICVWCKPHPGQGSFYRSQHELFFVLKKKGGKHNNRIKLGRNGRSRSNVWNYPGVSGGGAKARSAHADHPSPKNPDMIADILLDCTEPGDAVVDVFGGGGSLLVAAEKTGRRGRLIDLDPGYVDVMVSRWRRLTGSEPVLRSSGQGFDEVAAARSSVSATPRVRTRVRFQIG